MADVTTILDDLALSYLGHYRRVFPDYASFAAALDAPSGLANGRYHIDHDEQLQADDSLAVAPASVRDVLDGAIAGTENLSPVFRFRSHAEFSAAVMAGYQFPSADVDGQTFVRDDTTVDSYVDEKTGATVQNAGRGYWWLSNVAGNVRYRASGPAVFTGKLAFVPCNEASPIDMTQPLQSLMEAGHYSDICLTAMYYHLYTLQPTGVKVRGLGRGTGLRQLPGIRYCNVGGGTKGIFGSRGKLDNMAVIWEDIEFDGNYQQCADLTGSDGQEGNWASTINSSGQFEVGRLRCNGISAVTEGSVVVWRNVYSHDWARSCAFVGEGANVLYAGLTLKDSALDHLLYSDVGAVVDGSGLIMEGYARDGMMAWSGKGISGPQFRNFAENPNTIPAVGLDLQTACLIDFRNDLFTAGQMNNVSVYGDLSLIDTVGIPALARVRSHQVQLGEWKLDHIGAATGALIGVHVTGTPGAPGTFRGGIQANWVCRSMPERFQPFVSDKGKYGMSLLGFRISGIDISYHADAASTDLALVEFNGNTARDVVIDGLTVQTVDYSTGGPSRLYDSNCTSQFQRVTSRSTQRDNSTNAYEPVKIAPATTIKDNFIISDWSDNLSPPSTSTARTYARFRDCRFWNGYSSVNGVVTLNGNGTNNILIDLNNDIKMYDKPRTARVWLIVPAAGFDPAMPAIKSVQYTTTLGTRGAVRVFFDNVLPVGTGNVVLGIDASI